jgi:hypothetical protein
VHLPPRTDLTHLTEARAIAGDCYRAGESWVNGKVWEAEPNLLASTDGAAGPTQRHEVRARVRLNRVEGGVTHADGVLQMWFDGNLIIDVQNAVLRTSQHTEMKFNQMLMGPTTVLVSAPAVDVDRRPADLVLPCAENGNSYNKAGVRRRSHPDQPLPPVKSRGVPRAQ